MNRNSSSDIAIGIATVFVCNTAAAMSLFYVGYSLQNVPVVGTALVYASFGIGITQLIYVIPLCLWLRQRERFDTIKGVIIGAVITMLLNGGCFLTGVLSISG